LLAHAPAATSNIAVNLLIKLDFFIKTPFCLFEDKIVYCRGIITKNYYNFMFFHKKPLFGIEKTYIYKD